VYSNKDWKEKQMTKQEELIRVRIAKKGIYAEDIKHVGRLSEDEIAYLPVDKVYAWVRQGAWKTKDFNKWLKVMRVID
jgi:hypothetical protein